MEESVKVAVRCRPLSDQEQQDQVIECTESEVRVEQQFKFKYDSVFGPSSTQDQIYSQAAHQVVQATLQGYNGTIFAYGQTGTGKTHTMQGSLQSESEMGLVPRTFQSIFNHIAQNPSRQFLVSVSHIEIYNEEIYDLLIQLPRASSKVSVKRGTPLDLKEHPETGFHVKNLTRIQVTTPKQMMELMELGASQRSTGSTLMNERSSRSHSIFTITVESMPIETSAPTQKDTKPKVVVGKLNLVDLAGSERQSKSGSEGVRLKEASSINTSLLCLGNCIAALASNNTARHVPFRESKLTRLLMDSLGGTAKTVMLATISPSRSNLSETLSTLRYAERAKSIKNKVKVHIDTHDALLKTYTDQIQTLKQQIQLKQQASDVDRLKQSMEMQRLNMKQNMSKLADEKQKIMMDLTERQLELEKERQQQQQMEEHLKQLESKLVLGGKPVKLTDLILHVTQQRQELQNQEHSLQLEHRKHQDLQSHLSSRQSDRNQLENRTASLQEEANKKAKKLQKLVQVVRELQIQRNAKRSEFGAEREAILSRIRELRRQIQLRERIIEECVPKHVRESLDARLVFDQEKSRIAMREMPMQCERIRVSDLGYPVPRRLMDTYDDPNNKEFKIHDLISYTPIDMKVSESLYSWILPS